MSFPRDVALYNLVSCFFLRLLNLLLLCVVLCCINIGSPQCAQARRSRARANYKVDRPTRRPIHGVDTTILKLRKARKYGTRRHHTHTSCALHTTNPTRVVVAVRDDRRTCDDDVARVCEYVCGVCLGKLPLHELKRLQIKLANTQPDQMCLYFVYLIRYVCRMRYFCVCKPPIQVYMDIVFTGSV